MDDFRVGLEEEDHKEEVSFHLDHLVEQSAGSHHVQSILEDWVSKDASVFPFVGDTRGWGVHVFAGIYAHVCTWRPEDHFRYRPQVLHNLFETGSLTGLELTESVGLAGQQATGIVLCPLPQCWVYRHTLSCLDFVCVL